jgi:hypothetical protein
MTFDGINKATVSSHQTVDSIKDIDNEEFFKHDEPSRAFPAIVIPDEE